MNKKKLRKQYDEACLAYIEAFCKKQDMEFEGWYRDDVYCGAFVFNLQDIIWDIDSSQPKGRIISWYDDFYVNNHEDAINYRTYTKNITKCNLIALMRSDEESGAYEF